MSESAEELRTAVQGSREALTEAVTLAGQLNSHATDLAEEAAEHGWYGMTSRMQDVAGALEATAAQIEMGEKACESAVGDLDMINDKIPAGEVVTHLSASTQQLGEAEATLQGAIEKAEEAQAAAAEIGQAGMMQATVDLYRQLTEIREQIGEHLATSIDEHATAQTYAKKTTAKIALDGDRRATPPPEAIPSNLYSPESPAPRSRSSPVHNLEKVTQRDRSSTSSQKQILSVESYRELAKGSV